MAKAPRATLTRIATTITARYFPATGANDSFFLDGRLPGRRDHRAADITLDREDRGGFLAVFAHLTGAGQDEVATARVRKALDRILSDVKQNSRNIDAEINELAECAVDVAGRITLQHDGVRQPYFAGIIIKDSEMAAITMGSGCAYLYRGEALYPLTNDDFAMEAIDYHGKAIPGLDLYCAGVAGTVRYSNIAQLQLDDCLLLCNKEIMEALGQREVLRLLYEAEDQADAAGLIMTAASAKQPGVPMQCMTSFVENIQAVDKTGRISLPRPTGESAAIPAGRGQTGAQPTGDQTAAGAAAAVPVKSVPAAGNGRFNPPAAAPAGSAGPNGSGILPTKKTKAQTGRYTFDENTDEDPDQDAALYADEMESGGRGRRLAVYLIIAAVCIGCVFAIYSMLFKNKTPTTTTTTTAQVTTLDTLPSESSDGSTTESLTEDTTESETSIEDTTETSETQATTKATTKATTQANAGLPTTHTVKSGDTLYSIAKKYYGSGTPANITRIKNANNLTSDNLQIGDVLKIPAKN